MKIRYGLEMPAYVMLVSCMDSEFSLPVGTTECPYWTLVAGLNYYLLLDHRYSWYYYDWG